MRGLRQNLTSSQTLVCLRSLSKIGVPKGWLLMDLENVWGERRVKD